MCKMWSLPSKSLQSWMGVLTVGKYKNGDLPQGSTWRLKPFRCWIREVLSGKRQLWT